jgi:hypothetical protein
MFFRKKSKNESRLSKVDKLVTWIIIAWAVAWAVWLSKTEKGKKVIWDIKDKNKEKIWKTKKFFSKSYEFLWKTIAKWVSIFNKK